MRIRVEPVAVVVYDSRLYMRTGKIGRWSESLKRRFVGHAIREAPERGGALKRGIWGQMHPEPAQKRTEVTIHSDAKHTMYVLKGTTGPIVSDGYMAGDPGSKLKVRAWGGYKQRAMTSVSGQSANNFMARAAARTAVTNRSLRGFDADLRF